jgi:hypothetical protein
MMTPILLPQVQLTPWPAWISTKSSFGLNPTILAGVVSDRLHDDLTASSGGFHLFQLRQHFPEAV